MSTAAVIKRLREQQTKRQTENVAASMPAIVAKAKEFDNFENFFAALLANEKQMIKQDPDYSGSEGLQDFWQVHGKGVPATTGEAFKNSQSVQDLDISAQRLGLKKFEVKVKGTDKTTVKFAKTAEQARSAFMTQNVEKVSGTDPIEASDLTVTEVEIKELVGFDLSMMESVTEIGLLSKDELLEALELVAGKSGAEPIDVRRGIARMKREAAGIVELPPMKETRNFWITGKVDGDSKPVLEGAGPKAKGGGFSINILIRENGGISEKSLQINGFAKDDGSLRIDVEGPIRGSFTSKR